MKSRHSAIIASALLALGVVMPSIAQASDQISQKELSFIFPEDDHLTKEMAVSLSKVLPVISTQAPGSVPARLALARINATAAALTTPRIVGGVEAGPKEFPWQVALVLSGYPTSIGQFCGGSIIGEEWILTAAHCVVDMDKSQFNIYSGSASLNRGGQVTKIVKIITEGYDSDSMENDVALLKLEQPLQWSDYTKAIEFSTTDGTAMSAPGSLLLVSGWGVTSQGGASPKSLRKVVVPVVNTDQCNSPSFYDGAVLKGMICAGIGGKDSCQGDSGGPLITGPSEESPMQVGIVSWGYGCAIPNKPGVYTDVATYVGWIKMKTGL